MLLASHGDHSHANRLVTSVRAHTDQKNNNWRQWASSGLRWTRPADVFAMLEVKHAQTKSGIQAEPQKSEAGRLTACPHGQTLKGGHQNKFLLPVERSRQGEEVASNKRSRTVRFTAVAAPDRPARPVAPARLLPTAYKKERPDERQASE